MSELIAKTVEDMRWGRTSWRVLLALSIPALGIGVMTGLLR
jgi:hypothetical protein